MRRVLRPGGRIAFSVWAQAAEVPLIECALSCMRRLLPPPKVARPSIFRCGDPEWLQRRIASADFHDYRYPPRRLQRSAFADAASYWQGFLDIAGGANESLARLPAEKFARRWPPAWPRNWRRTPAPRATDSPARC
jgi:hypothetical protein